MFEVEPSRGQWGGAAQADVALQIPGKGAGSSWCSEIPDPCDPWLCCLCLLRVFTMIGCKTTNQEEAVVCSQSQQGGQAGRAEFPSAPMLGKEGTPRVTVQVPACVLNRV